MVRVRSRSAAARRVRTLQRTSHIMADTLFILVTIVVFVALAAFVYACDRV